MIDKHAAFLAALADGAPARVPPFPDSDCRANAFADAGIQSFYARLSDDRSLDAPYTAPTLDLDAAIWGGLVVHWACWAIVDRSQTNIRLPIWLSLEDEPRNASWHWSADLMLCVWPDVHRRCKTISNEDPLRQTLHEIAIASPLAAIGTGLATETVRERIANGEAWATIQTHRSLRALARDRIEKHRDSAFDTEPDQTANDDN